MINGYTTEQKQRHAYDMRENYQRILASYRATDFDEGEASQNLKIALTMKAKGYSTEQIIELTGLDPSEIQSMSPKET